MDNIVYNGGHRTNEIADLIIKLSYTINNYRLSTHEGEVNLLTNEEKK